MGEHRKLLADRLLSEERPITYRELSRSLNVHVNVAKGMLFDFHQYQNGVQPSKIHATYLVCGLPRIGDGTIDEVEMDSSFSHSDPISPAGIVQKLTLAGEEHLQEILSMYNTVTSIHIYALSPNTTDGVWLQHDFMHIESNNAAISALGNFGTVTNPNVRTRDRKSKPTFASSNSTKPAKQADLPQGGDKQHAPNAVAHRKPQVAISEKQPATASKGVKRGSIFQSFAKAATKPAVQEAKPKTQADCTSLALSDDGEADDSDILQHKSEAPRHKSVKSRKAREEELRRMMEEDDDEKAESDESVESGIDHEMEDSQEPEPQPQPQPQPAAKEKQEIEAPEIVSSSTGDGRRRGKRRVMKKKRILDDQGYMVTIQEPGWESFSEDETCQQPPTKKLAVTPTPSSSAAKVKKSFGKASQGSITSFFGKK